MDSNKVQIRQGVLKGAVFTTENNFEYFGFLGVPYAKPPVGELRFKAPQPADPWNGERDATVEGSICPQADMNTGLVSGKEDCLLLNVFTPKVAPSQVKFPVMVHIHGGGFIFGNGIIKDQQGPDYLIERDVVIVSINYRIAIFGFLSLDIPEAPGNMGLKDQIEALKWIQENISSFGGDPENVTIFGVSAGGASVDYLLVSPMAKGLFHQAIVQSGAAVNPWAINYNSKELALKVSKLMGYKGNDDNFSICKFLLERSAEELAYKSFEIMQETNEQTLYFGFVPTVEKELEGVEAFLTKNPYNLMKDGEFNKVPVIRGFTNTEGLCYDVIKTLAFEKVLEDQNFTRYFPYKLQFSQSVNEELKNIYMDIAATNPSDDRDAAALKFFSDLDFTAGVWNSGRAIAEHKVPVYMYIFTYEGGMNYAKNMFGITRPGSTHGDDIGYLFHVSGLIQHRTDRDRKVCDHFARMWTNFAKTGDPNPVDNGSTKWLPLTRQQKNYLVIDELLTLKNNYEPQRMAFFDDIYEKYEIK